MSSVENAATIRYPDLHQQTAFGFVMDWDTGRRVDVDGLVTPLFLEFRIAAVALFDIFLGIGSKDRVICRIAVFFDAGWVFALPKGIGLRRAKYGREAA